MAQAETRAAKHCWCWSHLRKGEGFAELAAGFGVGTATAWRYARETITLLAGPRPELPSALAAAKKAGHAFAVIDGTLIPIDRAAAPTGRSTPASTAATA